MIKKLLIFLGCIYMAIALFSCSPQKRLNRLVKNNPELAKTDTIYSSRSVTVAAYYKDTSAKASVNLDGLYTLLKKQNIKLDSLSKQKLVNYILNRPCLDEPLKIALSNGGTCIITQKAGIFYATVNEPARKYEIRVPLVRMDLKAEVKYNWTMFLTGFFTAMLLCVIVFVILKLKLIL